MGVMLTDIRVIKKLAALDDGRSMFWFLYFANDRSTLSEDYYFCQIAGRQGFDIWIDHDLSKEIKHVGTFECGHELVDPQRMPPLRKALDMTEAHDTERLTDGR